MIGEMAQRMVDLRRRLCGSLLLRGREEPRRPQKLDDCWRLRV